jgi:hypothetical protein
MTEDFAVKVEAPLACLEQLEKTLPGERQSHSKSISSMGGDPALIIEIAKASIPAVSAAIGAAAAMKVARSFKINNIETKGYSVADIAKLLEKLADLEKRRD